MLGLRSAGPATIPVGPAAADRFPSAGEPSSLVESEEVDADSLGGKTREGKPEEGPSRAEPHRYLRALAALPICRGFNHASAPPRLSLVSW